MDFTQKLIDSRAATVALAWWSRNRTDTSLPAIVLALWCVAISAHFDSRLYWARHDIYPLAHGAALIGIMLGRSALWQALVLVLQIWSLVLAMPAPDNHWFFSGFISLAMLSTLTYSFARARGRMTTEHWAYWHARTIPVLRVMIITLYLFAVLHKLNWDYFDPQHSCGMHFYDRAARARLFLPLDPDPALWFRHVVNFGVLALEASIPLFFMFRRTWFLGILFGVGFHLLTGVIMRHFPTIMIGLFFCYIPFPVARRFVDGIDRRLRALSGERVDLPAVLFAQALWFTVWALHMAWVMSVFEVGKFHEGTGYVLMLRVWLVLMVAGFVASIVYCVRSRSFLEVDADHLRSRWWLAYLFPLILVVNGFAPFLGLKSSTSIAMWSNLITAGGKSNHMLIPQGSLTVFPYMDDLVRIRRTNIRSWREKFISKRRLVPYVMLQRWVAERALNGQVIELEFERGGELYSYEHAELDPELTRVQPWWFQKIVHVKDYRRDLEGRCTW